MSWWRTIFGAPAKSAPAARTAARGASAGAASGDVGAALTRLYGEQQPFHLGAAVAFAEGGPDPLDGVSIYWSEHGPHFHYVSFGMAEVMGAELTFRLSARPSDRGTEPAKFLGSLAYNAPTWPISMLNMLARRVHRTKRPLAVGHWWEGAPGVLRPHTELHHLAFARDPELGTVTKAGGELTFLQAVGVTVETVESMKADEREKRGDATLDRLRRDSPLLVTISA